MGGVAGVAVCWWVQTAILGIVFVVLEDLFGVVEWCW